MYTEERTRTLQMMHTVTKEINEISEVLHLKRLRTVGSVAADAPRVHHILSAI